MSRSYVKQARRLHVISDPGETWFPARCITLPSIAIVLSKTNQCSLDGGGGMVWWGGGGLTGLMISMFFITPSPATCGNNKRVSICNARDLQRQGHLHQSRAAACGWGKTLRNWKVSTHNFRWHIARESVIQRNAVDPPMRHRPA